MHITSLEFSRRERIPSDANVIETYGGHLLKKQLEKDIKCLHAAPAVSSTCPGDSAVKFVFKWRHFSPKYSLTFMVALVSMVSSGNM